MPLITFIEIDKNARAAVLDLTEFSKKYTEVSKRTLEREGFLFLLEELIKGAAKALSYQSSGKPYLLNRSEHISLSHSHGKLAVIVDQLQSTGIDIELIRDKVLDIRHKFLRTEEMREIAEGEVEKCLVYWAAKETLYKIIGTKELNFMNDIFIDNFNYVSTGGIIKGEIKYKGKKHYHWMQYLKFEEYILVYRINHKHELV